MKNLSNIRNFCIIAHIDHGKSTLADRLLEKTNTVEDRKMQDQMLDTMDLERERGITIKLQPVRMQYKEHQLNLIDTPGHVDFTYEVSRSLACCEGALLIVDATQGIEAQTMANLYLAIEQGLEIIPVINKIDLPAADVPGVKAEIMSVIGCKEDEIIAVSAKTGENVEAVLDAVIERVPAPESKLEKTQALIFDSKFDDYRGVIAFVRVVEGSIAKGAKLEFMAQESFSDAIEVGSFAPKMTKNDALETGEIGYIITSFKDVAQCKVGDTVTLAKDPADEPLEGYTDIKPMVYAGLFCKEGDDYPELREALGKLKLNDAALTYEPENSKALGFGFRCGFLGLLHLDVIQERLYREYNLDLIVTAPSVAYQITDNKGVEKIIASPLDMPEPSFLTSVKEPMMLVDIVTPADYIGGIIQLLQEKRGLPTDSGIEYIDPKRVILHYQIPLAGLVVDFYDKLKNVSSGYASLNYEFNGYKECKVRRLDILVSGDPIEALATIVYVDEGNSVGKKIVASLKEVLPRQQYEVRLQAAFSGKIVASAKIPAMRKDVTAGLYGGDVSRKRKVLQKQKKGKARMKSMGKVDIPKEAFLAVLKR